MNYLGNRLHQKNGTQGFFTNCTTIESKPLKYPDDKFPLRILIWANPLKILKPGGTYKFKVQFAAIDKRIQLNPFLLVTQRNCVISLDDTNGLEYTICFASNRFNVATSKARLCTLLIAGKDIHHFTIISEEVSNYFKKIIQVI